MINKLLTYILILFFTFTSSVNACYTYRGNTGAGIFGLKNYGNENTNIMSGDSINKEGGATNRDWLMNQMSNAATFMTVLGNTIGKNNVVNGENARIKDRPLDGILGKFYFRHPESDSVNFEILHEQIFFEDEIGVNIGFFDDNEDKEELLNNYKEKDNIYYDDKLMRQAVKNVIPKPYNLFLYNCQHFIQDVRDEYNRLLKENK